MTDHYLSAKDIRAILGISRSRAHELMKEMQPIKFGRLTRVSQAHFARWVQRHEARAAARSPWLDETAPAQPPIRLTRPRDRRPPEPDGERPIRRMKPRT